MHDLAFFLFVIYSDLVKNSFRFALFFFHIGEGCEILMLRDMLLRHLFPLCTCSVVVK